MSRSILVRSLVAGVSAACLLSFLAARADADLVANWTFDSTYGSPPWTADSAGSNPGQLRATATFPSLVPGKLGNALSFNGADNECVRVNNADALNPTSISVSAWVNTTDAGQYQGIVDKITNGAVKTGYVIDFSAGVPRFETWTDSGTVDVSGGTINDGAWHLVTGTFDGTSSTNNVNLYVDGVLKATQSVLGASYRWGDTGYLCIAGDGTLRTT